MFLHRECTRRSGKSCDSWQVCTTGSRRECTEDIHGLREIVDALEQRVVDLMDKFDATIKQINHQQQMCLEFRQAHRQHEELYQLLSERTFQRMDQFQGALESVRKECFSLAKEVFVGGKELDARPQKKLAGGVHPQREQHLERDFVAEGLDALQQLGSGPTLMKEQASSMDRQRHVQKPSRGIHQLSQRRECDPRYVESTLIPSRNQGSYATDIGHVSLTFDGHGHDASMGGLPTQLVERSTVQDIEDGVFAGCQPSFLGLAAEERMARSLKMEDHTIFV